MDGIRNSSELELQLIVTGMHLSQEFGLTFREIEKDGFHIDRKIEMLVSSDTPVATRPRSKDWGTPKPANPAISTEAPSSMPSKADWAVG